MANIKQNIVGITFFTKNIPSTNILNSKLHIKDEYTKLSNTSLTFFQRLKTFLKDLPCIFPTTKASETTIRICI